MTDPHQPPLANEAYIDDDGIIRAALRGSQSAETIEAHRHKMEALIAELHKQNKQACIYMDLTAVKVSSTSTRTEARKFLDLPFEAAAIVGNAYLQPIVAYVLRITGKTDTVRYFSQPAEAERWLLNPTLRLKTGGIIHTLATIPVSSWLLFVVVLATGALSYVSWQQSQDRITSSAQAAFTQSADDVHTRIGQHLQAYIDALVGIQGLYHASNSVEEKEFTNYYKTVNLQARHPGFNNITFVAKVTRASKNTFLATVRGDKTQNNNTAFTITPAGDRDEYAVVTFIGDGAGGGAGKGVDLLINDSRKQNFYAARDSGEARASQSITLLNKDGTPGDNLGFLISVPVYADRVPTTLEQRRSSLEGYVNSVFTYHVLMQAIFKEEPLPDIQVVLRDDQNKIVYEQGETKTDSTFTRDVPIEVAGRQWKLSLVGPANYKQTGLETRLPMTIGMSGALVTALLLALFITQVRAKLRAIQLADMMTEDLQHERNNAIAIRNKDEAILSSIGDGVFALGNTGIVTLFNKKAEELTGMQAGEVLGKKFDEVLHFENKDKTVRPNAFIEQSLAGKMSEMAHGTLLKRKDGSELPVADSAAPIFDAEGKQHGVIVVFRDVTEQARLDQSKDEFISIASHQLRTPLTAIRLFNEMLKNGDVGKLNPEQQDYTNKVDLSVTRMIRLVGDILNVSRVDLGRVMINPKPTDVNELIQSHIDEVTPLADPKGVTLHFTPDTNLPKVNIDPDVFGQVIHNLLTNAIRYTAEKQGKVEVKFVKKDDGYEYSVTDNGIGIPKDAQSHIFERFYRAPNAIAVEGEGTGLGLYLIKTIVDTVGGTVRFETSEHGTTFFVTIPERGMKAKEGVTQLK